jgi:transcriptional regulator GlxA family with amidase domain
MPSERPIRLAFLLAPQFSMMAFSAAVEPLRAANRVSGRTLYEWKIVSTDGRPVVASNGISIDVACGLEQAGNIDMLAVCVALDPLRLGADRQLRGRLRYLASHGCLVGGITGGPFVLADAGLLNGRRCTVHWEYADLFQSRYRQARLTHDLFVVDKGVFTCSGGTAALDLMLHFIGEQHGPELALSVAEQFIHPRIRAQDDHQRMATHARYRVSNPKLAEVIRIMGETLGEPAGLARIAARVQLSTRQVERLFARNLAVSPSRFYLEMRLDRARQLLRESSETIRSIAIGVGFGSTSHFSAAYRRLYGHTPTEERRLRMSRPAAKTSSRINRAAAPRARIAHRKG